MGRTDEKVSSIVDVDVDPMTAFTTFTDDTLELGRVTVWEPGTRVAWQSSVDDLDAHLSRSTAAGATIVEPINHHGFRAYTAADPEGRRWTFAQARPTMA